MASRALQDLLPEVATMATKHRSLCLSEGIDLLIYCTLRDAEEQGRIFCQGRTTEQIIAKRDSLRKRAYPLLAAMLGSPLVGKRITDSGPGESYHQYARAYDCVPLIGGKPDWSTTGASAALWDRVGRLGEQAGLEWAGRWKRFRECPHFQLRSDLDIAQLMKQRYGGNARTAHIAPPLVAAAGTDVEEDALRTLLSNRLHRILLVCTFPDADEQLLQKVVETAKAIAQFNPASWCVFWIRHPKLLSDDLNSLTVGARPICLLGQGDGLNRPSMEYALEDVDEPQKIFDLFASSR